MSALVLRNVRIDPVAAPVNITITDGHIAEIAPAPTELRAPPGADERDMRGHVALAGLVDLHTHLDKTFCDVPNRSGTLREAIDVWLSATHLHTRASVEARAERALRRALSHGTTAIRTHVDVVTRAHLESVEALLTLRERFRDRIDLQIVALGCAGRSKEERELMEAALNMGVDFVGGAPALDPDPTHSVRAIVEMAVKYGKPIDAHIDETEDPRSHTLLTLAELTRAHGLRGRVTAGHCVSLAFMSETEAARVIEQVVAAGITVVTLPSCNLNLIGRASQPAPRGVTRVKQLAQAGVTVVAASDNVRDPFNPFGDYNLLHIANLCAHTAHMSGVDELRVALDMVGRLPAAHFYGQVHRFAAGARADLAIFEATDPAELLLAMPRCAMTIKAGRIVHDVPTD